MIYYTFFQNISGVKISPENQIFNYSRNAHEDILKILKAYYEVNKNQLPENIISVLEDSFENNSLMIENKEEFDFFAPIIERCIYTDGEIKNNQIVGLALIYNDLYYVKLVNALFYSFQVSNIPSDVEAFYLFEPYKNKLAPSAIHFSDSVFSYAVYVDKEEDDDWIDGEGID